MGVLHTVAIGRRGDPAVVLALRTAWLLLLDWSAVVGEYDPFQLAGGNWLGKFGRPLVHSCQVGDVSLGVTVDIGELVEPCVECVVKRASHPAVEDEGLPLSAGSVAGECEPFGVEGFSDARQDELAMHIGDDRISDLLHCAQCLCGLTERARRGANVDQSLSGVA